VLLWLPPGPAHFWPVAVVTMRVRTLSDSTSPDPTGTEVPGSSVITPPWPRTGSASAR